MEEELKRLLNENKVIPFVGAGVSMAVKYKNGNNIFPNWHNLLHSFADKLLELDKPDDAKIIQLLLKRPNPNYLEIADKIKEYFPTIPIYEKHIESIFDIESDDIDRATLELSQKIWELNQNLIITTNYDKTLYWASKNINDTKCWDIQSVSEQAGSLRDGVSKPTIWHLHGHIDNKSDIILTSDSYQKLYENNNSAFKTASNTLKHYLASRSFLFIGYSLDDAYLVNELEKVCDLFECKSSEHYVLLKKGQILPSNLHKKITPIFFDDFGHPLIDKIKSLIPTTYESKERLLSATTIPTKNNADYLTSLPPRNENFLGRVDELKKLEDTLTNEGMVYVVNGIGGVGKSELSYEYLHRNKERYNNIAFLEFSDERTSIEELFRIKFKERFALSENDNLDSIINKLQGLKTKNLLLIDNLQNREDFEKIKALNSNFHLLITTRRSDLESRYKLNLEVLSDEDARALFVRYYPTEENINDILNYLDNHSLFIYLTAKTLESNYLTLEELRENIKSGQIGKIEAHDEKSFDKHLEQRFKRQFEEEENPDLKLLLQQLSTLPSIEIEEEKLLRCITDDNLKKNLAKLVQRGWLTKKDNSYKLHQIIKTFIWDNYPLPYKNAIPIINAISSYIDTDDSAIIVNYELIFIPIIDSLVSLYGENKDNHIASILDSLTFLYYSTGNYKKSLEIQIDSKIIRLNIFGENSVEVAKNYNLEGVLHKVFGEYQKTFPLYLKALDIREKAFGENHHHTLQSYNNLAVIYEELNKPEEASFLFKKVLDIRINLYGENHSDTASAYNNLATFYHASKEYQKALPLNEKALKIREEILGEKHPNTANSYNNLAALHNDLGHYSKAHPLYVKAMRIREEILGTKHPDTAQSYHNLAVLYLNTNEHKKALFFFKKALQIQEEFLSEKHPDIALTYYNLSHVYESLKQCHESIKMSKQAINILDKLNPSHSNLFKYKQHLKKLENKIEKERKLPFNKRGRYCKD